MDRYKVVLIKPRQETDYNGDPITLPVGAVINVIVWDGVTEYDPGDDCELVKE